MGLEQLRSALAEHEGAERFWEDQAAGLGATVSTLAGQLDYKRGQLALAQAADTECGNVVDAVSQVEDDLRQLGANLASAIGEDVSSEVEAIASGDADTASAAKSACEALVASLQQEIATLEGSLATAQGSLSAATANAASARARACAVRLRIRNYSER